MSDFWKKAQEGVYRDMSRPSPFNKPLPKPRTITEVAAEREEELKLEAVAPKTGYPDLDEIIRGFIPGHLYTMTGVENIGKTSLACNFADRVRRQGHKVMYFALEPENTVVDYLASVRTDKAFTDLTGPERAYDDGNIHVYGKQEISTVGDLARIVRETETRYNLIIIDHIGYFIAGDKQNINVEQSNVLKRLAGLAKEKQVAILLIAHLRKRPPGAKKNWIPTSDDISGSGAFKQDSTEVMIVTRNIVDPEGGGLQYANDGVLFITKTKAGPNGQVLLMFSDRKANITTMGEIMAKKKENKQTLPFTEDEKW